MNDTFLLVKIDILHVNIVIFRLRLRLRNL